MELRGRSKILLVDDSPANLLALKAILEPLGQELVEALSGEEALRHLLVEDFAVILMDVQMPGLDGLETAALIKGREKSRHIPIIFVTALSREIHFVVKGYSSGGVDYLLKPIDPDILRAKVTVFVDLYQRGEFIKQQALEISERKRVEAEIERAYQFQQMLVGIIGHDIRSPLSALLATARMLLNMGELTPKQAAAIERISRSGARIEGIVKVLIDFAQARIGGGIRVDPVPMDLKELPARVVEELQPVHPALQLEATSSGDTRGEWDPERLMQVMVNLVDNAAKYGDLARPIRVHVAGVEDEVVLEVHNFGAQIPTDQIALLFEPFRRGAQSAETVKVSLGLGLYIVAELVKAHGGSVEVRSTAEEGTTFRVRLPRRRAATAS